MTADPDQDRMPDPPASASVLHNASTWITRWAARRPERTAWADDERRVSWAEADVRIARLAAWMRERGVAPGDRVALWLGNRVATLEALFAGARLGAIVLPINGRLTATEVAFQLADARPKLLLIERRHREAATIAIESIAHPGSAAPHVLEVGSASDRGSDDYENVLERSSPLDTCCAVTPDAPMILMYTSGTTGKPKGALLPHRKALYNSLNAQLFFDISASDRVLVVAPLFHSLGLQILSLPAIYVGATLILQEGFEAERVWSTLHRERISYFGGVPTMHQRLLDTLDPDRPDRRPPDSLRFIFTAGAAAPAEMIRAFHDRGVLMKQGYGQTETSVLTCLEPEQALAKAGSVGRPVFHAELRLVDPDTLEGAERDWRDVAESEVGEVIVRGPITMLGYWERPEETAATLRGEWVRTGDLATRDADFDLTLVGRAREMYISGGENVYPAEVEAAMMEHPAIREVAVVARPDPDWGETGRAHVVLEASLKATPTEIGRWLSERLARFKQPSEIRIEDALPRTASGKVQKHGLVED